jgi:transcriptional regulator with XRE-family HTH domain
MGTSKKHIGELIKSKRVLLNMSADEVAEACNVSRSRVYQWEQAPYVMPKNLRALSTVLQIPLERLEAANGSRPE